MCICQVCAVTFNFEIALLLRYAGKAAKTGIKENVLVKPEFHDRRRTLTMRSHQPGRHKTEYMSACRAASQMH